METTALAPANGRGISEVGSVSREEFGASQLERRAETASAAAAAQAQAAVQARYVMALQRPRNIDEVRHRLLKECERARFAETAIYRKPVGGGRVEGFSIRFAEAALRAFGNVYPEVMTVFDDVAKRIVRITVTDLESNVSWAKDVTIAKTVERREPKGYEVLSKRQNKQGDTIYICVATEDDLLNRENALVSKAVRTNGLRLIPGDLLDEAKERIHATQRKADKEDPEGARKRLADAFAALGVLPKDLADYLGKPDLSAITPDEIQELRTAYQAIREGEAKWRDIVADRKERLGQDQSQGQGQATTAAKPSNAREAARQKAAEAQAQSTSAATSTTPQTHAHATPTPPEASGGQRQPGQEG